MRGVIRVNFMARKGFKRFCGSKSGKEGSEGPLPFLMMVPVGKGREGASFTTTFREAITMRRRTADSAGLSTPNTALCRDRGIREAASLLSLPGMLW